MVAQYELPFDCIEQKLDCKVTKCIPFTCRRNSIHEVDIVTIIEKKKGKKEKNERERKSPLTLQTTMKKKVKKVII